MVSTKPAAAQEDELIDALEEGVRAWKKLKGGIGLNLADVFRRYSLIEPVLVPIHIAISPSDSISLNRLLTDAHRAFIFGTYFAAIALCRSLTEHIIRDHYRIGPLDPEKRYPLEKRLQTAKQGDNEYLKNEVDDFLIQFVKEANDILHANTSRLFHRDRIEQTIVRWLEKIRRLIENLQSKS